MTTTKLKMAYMNKNQNSKTIANVSAIITIEINMPKAMLTNKINLNMHDILESDFGVTINNKEHMVYRMFKLICQNKKSSTVLTFKLC